MGQMIWRLMLGRLLLMFPLPIISVSFFSASLDVLLHSQGGGGAVEQSHPVETGPSPT